MATSETALQGRRVLVAEDEFIIGYDLEGMLAGFGCAVLGPVPSVAAAEALLAAERPDMALLDLVLGDALAVALFPKLRAMGVPFALLTGYDPEVVGLHGQQGVPCLRKPYGEAELRELLLDLVAAQHSREPIPGLAIYLAPK